MRVLLIEKTMFICFLYNSVLLCLYSYINHRNDYLKFIIISVFLSILDIICLYVSSNIALIITYLIILSIPLFITNKKNLREFSILVASMLIIIGATAILPINNIYYHTLAMTVLVFLFAGFIPIFTRNNYIRTTTASIFVPGGVHINALIDTGLICDDAPVIVTGQQTLKKFYHTQPNTIIQENLNINTVNAKNNMPSIKIPILYVKVNGKKQTFNNVVIIISNQKLPREALISAQGLS